MTNTEKEKPVKLGGMQAHTRGLFNKGIGSEGTCSTAAATAAKEVILGTTFDLVPKATILVTFTNGISVANATLAVTHTDLAGNTTTEEAKAINYRGSALAADLVKSGDKVLLRYDGTAFNVIGVLDQDLSGKQDVINDLSDIRSGASAGATAYQKPSGGIPASDLAFTPATLTDGKVPSSQLPSYVDDVIEGYLKKTDGKFYAHKSGSTYTDEITGETGKIYVDLNTNKSYRWSGSAFVEISSSDVTGIKVGSSGTTITPSEGVITIPAYEEGAQVHIAPTATEVKSALGTGSGTSKYLREDGTWQTPTDNNTTYKFTIGTTTNGDATNGVDLGTLKSEAAAASGTTLSLVTTGEKATWNSKTSNTGTVTKVTAGTGLTGGDITTSGTIALDTSGATAGTYKSVTVDAYGRVTGGTNPTTLSGYGITDAKIASGTITLGSNTITPLTSHQDISGKADKSATVSTVTYDTTNKKLTKTINGTTTDVVTSAKIVEDGGGNLVKLNIIELESLAHNYSFKVNDAMYVGAALYKCTAATTKPPFNFVFDSNNSIVVDRINGQDAVVCDSDTLNTGWEKVLDLNDRYYVENRVKNHFDIITDTNVAVLGNGYGVCETDATTAAKVVSIGNFILKTNGIVSVRFTKTIDVADATLNVSGTGAKTIRINGSNIQPGAVRAGNTVMLQYDGTYWNVVSIQGLEQGAAETDLWVDLGLPSGLKWANRNINVETEDGFSNTPYTYDASFFSWGNAQGHNPDVDIDPSTQQPTAFSYDWGTSNSGPYASTPGSKLTGNIPPSMDAARMICGAPWRMPTSAEFQELFDNCKFVQADGTTEISASTTNKLVTKNGVVGIYLKSKKNGNNIFFPCSGLGSGTSLYNRGSHGFYWSGSLISAANGRNLGFNSGGIDPQSDSNRFYGFAIRPVF